MGEDPWRDEYETEIDRDVVEEADKREKAAKAEKDSRNALIEGYTIGAFTAVKDVFQGLNRLGENPILQVLNQFITLLGDRINAEFAESAAKLAETLFSESSVKAVDDMAEGFGTINEAIGPTIESTQQLDKALRDFTGGQIGLMNVILGPLSILNATLENIGKTSVMINGVFSTLLTNLGSLWDRFNSIYSIVDDVTSRFGSFYSRFDDFYDLLKKIIDEIEKVT